MDLIDDIKPSQPPGRRNFYWFGLLVLYLLLYVLPLGNRPLAIPDETRYAEIPREMLVTGDWVTPRLNGLRYFEKTPLGYWLNAASISVFGENPFAVRLPGALAAGLTILLTFLFSVKAFSSRKVALMATLFQMTFLEVYFVGTFSVLDNLLTLFLSGSIMSFYLAVKAHNSHLAWAYYILAGLLIGLAFLTKGFLAIAIPVIVLVPWLLLHAHWRPLLLKSWFVLLIAALVVLPWGLLIQLRESDFWHYFFWVEHIRRFTAENAQHKAPFYYFLVLLPVLAFPWISFVLPAVSGLRALVNKRELLQFLYLWLVIPFVFFSLSHGKLATYILPCFPPLAILIAAGVEKYLRGNNTRLFNYAVMVNGLLLVLVLVGLFAQTFVAKQPLYRQEEDLKLVILVLALLTGIVACIGSIKFSRVGMKLVLSATAVLPFIVFVQWAVPDQLMQSKTPAKLFTQIANKLSPDTLLVTDGTMLRAVDWYLKRDDVYLFNSNEMAYGLSYPDASGRLLDSKAFAALLAGKHNRHMAVFCNAGCPEAIERYIPVTSQHYHYGKFSMWFIP